MAANMAWMPSAAVFDAGCRALLLDFFGGFDRSCGMFQLAKATTAWYQQNRLRKKKKGLQNLKPFPRRSPKRRQQKHLTEWRVPDRVAECKRRDSSPRKKMESSEFYNVMSLAKFLGVSRETIRRWTKSGKLPAPIKLSGITRRWRKTDIAAWLEAYEPAYKMPSPDSPDSAPSSSNG